MLLDESRMRAKRERIVWSEEEWDRLAEIVFHIRLRDPEASLTAAAQRAVEQFPKPRQRTLISNNALGPLIQRLKLTAERMKADAAEAASLRQSQSVRPDPERVMSEMGDDEVMRRFGDRVLRQLGPEDALSHFSYDDVLELVPPEELIACAARWMVGTMMSLKAQPPAAAQRPPTHEEMPPPAASDRPVPKAPRKPHVVVVGAKGNQWQFIAQGVNGRARLQFVDKEKNQPIPDGADLYLFWAKFGNHATQNEIYTVAEKDRVIVHHGGVSGIVKAIKGRLAAAQPQ